MSRCAGAFAARNGFALFDAIIAAVILGVALLALAGGAATAARRNHDARVQTVARLRAETAMERALARRAGNGTAGEEVVGPFRVRWWSMGDSALVVVSEYDDGMVTLVDTLVTLAPPR